MQPYVVRQGEFLLQLAYKFGFDADSVWQDPQNASLVALRSDPNTLFPGDVLYVPTPPPTAGASLKTGSTNNFVSDAPTMTLTQQFAGPDPSMYASRAYTVQELTQLTGLTTDANGVATFSAPVTLTTATIVFGDTGETWTLGVGQMDPINTLTGIFKRLQNLGYIARDTLFDTNDPLSNLVVLRTGLVAFKAAQAGADALPASSSPPSAPPASTPPASTPPPSAPTAPPSSGKGPASTPPYSAPPGSGPVADASPESRPASEQGPSSSPSSGPASDSAAASSASPDSAPASGAKADSAPSSGAPSSSPQSGPTSDPAPSSGSSPPSSFPSAVDATPYLTGDGAAPPSSPAPDADSAPASGPASAPASGPAPASAPASQASPPSSPGSAPGSGSAPPSSASGATAAASGLADDGTLDADTAALLQKAHGC
jgi:hypothetical protein